MNQAEYYEKQVGKTVFLRRKSDKKYLIIGKIELVFDDKIIITSEKDQYSVDYNDIFAADIKAGGMKNEDFNKTKTIW